MVLGIWWTFAWIAFWTLLYTSNVMPKQCPMWRSSPECDRNKLKGWEDFLCWMSRPKHSFPKGAATRNLARFSFRMKRGITLTCSWKSPSQEQSCWQSQERQTDLTRGLYCPVSTWPLCPSIKAHSQPSRRTLFHLLHLYVCLGLSQTLNILTIGRMYWLKQNIDLPLRLLHS